MSNENSAPAGPFRLEVSGGFFLLLALGWLVWGEATLCAALLAAAVHELGHLAVLAGQGSIPRLLRLDASGAMLRWRGGSCSRAGEVCRALAGPGAGLVLFAFLRLTPVLFLRRVSDMSLMLTLVNLLPHSALDGGRALDALLGPGIMTLRAWLDGLCAALCLSLGALRSPPLFVYGLWLLARTLRPD